MNNASSSSAKRYLLIALIILCNVAFDQASKTIVRHNVVPEQPMPVIENVFTIIRVENTGAFLSVGDSLSKPVRNILLSVLPLLALIFGMGYIMIKNHFQGIRLWAICCILGGGIGNVYDRIVHGSVTDFLHINFGIFQTGIFNLADMSITTGVLLLLIASFSKKDKEESIAVD